MKKVKIIELKKIVVILLTCILIVATLSIIILKNKKNNSLTFSPNTFTDKIVVVDAGHGGIDGGTSDLQGNLEKDINLSVALKLKKYLKENGAFVIMTRNEDVSLENKSRLKASRYLRDLDARKSIINDNDLTKVFVSIHVNFNINKKPRGIEIYHYPTSGESKYIALMMKKKIDDIVYNGYLGYKGQRCKIIPRDFFILRETNKPGILVEIGYLSNPEDNKLLKRKSYQNTVARAIGECLIEYINE